MKKALILLMIVLITVSTVFPIHASIVDGETECATIPFATYLQSQAYEANEKFRFDGNTVGTLLVEGASFSGKQIDGIDLYVAENSHVNIALFYNVSQMSKPYIDYQTAVDDYDLGASVQRGSVTVMVKTDPDSPYTPVLTACDVLRTHPMGSGSIYTPASGNLVQGLYIKVMFAFAYYSGDSSNLKRQLQVAEFYVFTKTDPLFFDLFSESDGLLTSDGACTTSGFEIAVPRTTRISVSYNGSPLAQTDQTLFQTPGRYDLLFQAPDGTQTTKRIFVLPSKESTFQRYFPDGLILEATRFFSTNDVPTYEVAAFLSWNQPSNLPPLFGILTNLETGEVTNLSMEQGFLAIPEGRWTVSFQCGDEGSFYLFEQSLEVLQTAPESTVNEHFLNEWCDKGNAAASWRPVSVPFQCDRMIALNQTDESATELVFGQCFGDQLAPGIYTIREISKTSGKIYSYTLDLRETDTPIAPNAVQKEFPVVPTVAVAVTLLIAVIVYLMIRRKHRCSNND